MAQFDVYENPNPNTRESIPFLLDVQADLLTNLATRVVVPLFTTTAMGRPAKHLHPQFKVNEIPVIMSTAEIAGVNVRELGGKVGTLREHREQIIHALDFLFTGF